MFLVKKCMTTKVRLSLSSLLLTTLYAQPTWAQLTPLGTQPLISRSTVAPNVIFALSVEYPTGSMSAYQERSGYTPVNEYIGYFDPVKCYRYDGDNDWFYAVGTSSDRTCGGLAWSGNFLNWGTNSGLDSFRLAMTGGHRYVDTPSLTVLERGLQSGQGGATDKELTSSSTNRILNEATPLLGASTDGSIFIHSTGRREGTAFWRTLVAEPVSLTFAQQPSTMVRNIRFLFKNQTTVAETGLTYRIRLPQALDSSKISVSGSPGTYNSSTGELSVTGPATLNPNATHTITVSYQTPFWSPYTTVTAHMFKSGVAWGEVRVEKQLSVRVRVCDPSVGLERNCQRYGSSSYKPVGVVQQNGEHMRFGVFSYYHLNNTEPNGVMRTRMKVTSPFIVSGDTRTANPKKEWSATDGTFYQNPDVGETSFTTYTDSGVINYINKFGRSNSYKYYDDIGRLYYTALAYLRNKPNYANFHVRATSSTAENFPIIPSSAWEDPIQATCQSNYILILGDKNTNCDKKLPGGRFTSSYYWCPNDIGALENGDTLDVWEWTNKIGMQENRPTLADLSPHYNNNTSFYLSGLSYYAYTSDIRPDDSTKPATVGKQNVKTFIFDVQEGGPGENSQFWYAAKYGGFDNMSGANKPTTMSSWSVADGTYPSGRRPTNLIPVNNPKAMSEGIKSALSSIAAETGSASAAATSSPNVTQANNYIYSSTYRTTVWDGELIAQRIDVTTGDVLPTVLWQGSASVNTQADAVSNGTLNARKLYTFNTATSAVDKKKDFTYAAMSTLERSWFTDKCTPSEGAGFTQCIDGSLTSAQMNSANSSSNLVNFLRGYNNRAFGTYGYLDIFRPSRVNRLGDAVNAAPVYVNEPLYKFAMTTGGETYAQYKTRVSGRTSSVFLAANDGFLHSFNGLTGTEQFAYVPRQLMPDLYILADKEYSTKHRYFVDGTPVTMDVYDTATSTWKTLLVGGLNNGGKGYYALDITNPTSPQVLWEVCSDSTRCPTNTISTLGKSYGNPVVTRLPSGTTHAGKWVVLMTSGYNNSTGHGYLYVLDAITGQALDIYTTGTGTAGSPSGLSKLTTFAPNFSNDAISNLAYAGDLEGNIWRFDLSKISSADGAVQKIVQLKDSANNPQPITTKIEVGVVPGNPTWPALFVGTGRYLSTDDIPDTQTQSVYGLKDPYSSGATGGYSSSRGTGWVAQTVIDQTLDGRTIRTINSPQNVNWTSKNGWVLDLPDTGERVALDVQLNLGTLLVSTNVVSDAGLGTCQVGGSSWLYQLNYSSGSYIPGAPSNQVATKFANALVVGNVVTRLPSGALKVISTTAKGDKVTSGYRTGASGGGGRRISWREITK